MPQLLLEIFSEEIPARMQAQAEDRLTNAMAEWLAAAGISPKSGKSFSGPRRIGCYFDDLPEQSADTREERKGPKVGAPEKAIEGFMRGAGLTSIDQAEIREDKKGDFYVAVIEKPGRRTVEVIATAVTEIIKDFHWPKSMRWGEGDLRWVRPIQRILCTFDGKVVPFEIGGVHSGDETEGHRVMGRGPFKVKGYEDYIKTLREKGFVVSNSEERKAIILEGAKKLCADAKLELVEDIGLLNEVAGLAEWPVVLMGDMDPAFLDLPPEVIKLSMRTHQKYFAVRDPKKDGLAPKFIVVANLEASDGGKMIADGNSRVLSARLNDARFFWDNDRKAPLESRFEKLGSIVFHEKLGSVKDKAERVMALARELAPLVGADPDQAERAAKLAKCDLVSEMVFEFPELQGVMGRYYALAPPLRPSADADGHLPPSKMGGGQGDKGKSSTTNVGEVSRSDGGGEAQAIADAIRDHYKPQGPSDDVPSDPVSVAVALADKLDTLVGFWAIDEKPTGSRDPFALRRAALGVIRIVLANGLRFGLMEAFGSALRKQYSPFALEFASDAVPKHGVSTPKGHECMVRAFQNPFVRWGVGESGIALSVYLQASAFLAGVSPSYTVKNSTPEDVLHHYQLAVLSTGRFVESQGLINPVRLDIDLSANPRAAVEDGFENWVSSGFEGFRRDLLSFFADRLKVHLREQGARHDLIDAVFALGEDDLVLIVKRVEALGAFLDTEDGANLLAGFKRAANILKAEEKKDDTTFSGDPEPKQFAQDEERNLHAALQKETGAASKALEAEDFTAAMGALAELRGPVDAFFDKVTVNADDAGVRKNRLVLLAQIRDGLGQVADFSKIEG